MTNLIRVNPKTKERLNIVKTSNFGPNYSYDKLIVHMLDYYIDTAHMKFYDHIRDKEIFKAISELQLYHYVSDALSTNEKEAIVCFLTKDHFRGIMILINSDMDLRNRLIQSFKDARVMIKKLGKQREWKSYGIGAQVQKQNAPKKKRIIKRGEYESIFEKPTGHFGPEPSLKEMAQINKKKKSLVD